MKSVLNRMLLLALWGITFSSCKKMLEPNEDNHSTIDRVYYDPYYAEGLLIRAYTLLPSGSYTFSEVATDDAVTNNLSSSYLKMGTGAWSAMSNPENLWKDSYTAIMYVNQFLAFVDTVNWKITDRDMNDLYARRLRGEAYAIRGLFKYYLLRNHGGYGKDNDGLLGFQDNNIFFVSREDFSSPRMTFSESVNSAYADLDSAIALLPETYANIEDYWDLPNGFDADIEQFNTVFGNDMRQRVNGLISEAFKARIALLAASPAFNENNDLSLWEKAANYTAKVLETVGGISGLDPKGNEFFSPEQIVNTNLTSGNKMDIPEILWRTRITASSSLERNNFPPSMFGDGQVNPSQNLVDAYPMANGYPIDHPSSGYDPDDPYAGRDPRLARTILFNGNDLKNTPILTQVGSSDDNLNFRPNSTRTGYYLKKLLREDVNANPTSTNSQDHYVARIRYTELFLNYAEAANEAWGPEGTGGNGYSAKEVIGAIRNRAGIKRPDAYLSAISTKEEMRDLIQNERRLELAFEDFRFWDLRRWAKDLTEPVQGVRITSPDGVSFDYTYFTVEERNYDNNFMHYGPIPNNEVVRFEITQNKGW